MQTSQTCRKEPTHSSEGGIKRTLSKNKKCLQCGICCRTLVLHDKELPSEEMKINV